MLDIDPTTLKLVKDTFMEPDLSPKVYPIEANVEQKVDSRRKKLLDYKELSLEFTREILYTVQEFTKDEVLRCKQLEDSIRVIEKKLPKERTTEENLILQIASTKQCLEEVMLENEELLEEEEESTSYQVMEFEYLSIHSMSENGGSNIGDPSFKECSLLDEDLSDFIDCEIDDSITSVDTIMVLPEFWKGVQLLNYEIVNIPKDHVIYK